MIFDVKMLNEKAYLLEELQLMLNNPKQLKQSLSQLIEENSEFLLSSLIIRPTYNVINGSQVSATYSYSTASGYNGEVI